MTVTGKKTNKKSPQSKYKGCSGSLSSSGESACRDPDCKRSGHLQSSVSIKEKQKDSTETCREHTGS